VQAPAPLQTPVVPQLEAGIAWQFAAGSAPPLGTGVQVPCLPATAHELQLPQLDDPQQTPSVQWPLAQALSAVQAVPLGERSVQIPDWQVSPAAQSALVVHAVRQALAPQPKGAQAAVVCLQVPAPSQLPALMAVPAAHEGAPQLVPTAAARQAPAPLQVPSNPQGGAAAQPPCGSLVPAATAVQVPAEPATLQAAHVPQLAVPQQTPSTQLPPWHSFPIAQAWPSRLRPHEPPLQTFPGAQSASLLQTATQAVPLQAKGAQLCVPAGWQTPAPSQVRASVAVIAPVGQAGATHWVPAAYS